MFVMKMPSKKRKKRNFESVGLIILLILGIKLCDAQMSSEEDDSPLDRGSHSSAFFALRSCHQVLTGDSGEFFSPDYLCSNPPLWCNWTIQVHAGKRIYLQLDDLGPDDGCHGRRDQIHIDEPEGQRSSKHSVLQQCWREATYTSSSRTVHVVLLIEGSPTPTYRGFYGRYQAFGPPQVYHPQDQDYNSQNQDYNSQNQDYNGPSPVTAEPLYNYYEETMLEKQHEANGEDQADDNLTSNSEIPLDSTETPSEEEPEHDPEPSPRVFTAIRRNVDETYRATDQSEAEEETADQSDNMEGRDRSEDMSLVQSEEKNWEEEETNILKQMPSPSKEVQPQFDHRADTRAHVKYHPQSPHLPGDLLFEVSVEVNLTQDSDAPFNDVAQSLLLSVKNLIKDQLKYMLVSPSISSKRIKRLNAGVLFILWLQMGQRTGRHHAHDVIHSALQDLIGASLGTKHRDSVVMSLSTADVNECDTQLVVCGPNADCVNHFGSYSCHCGTDFRDMSQSGTGTVCVDTKDTDCSPSLSSEAKAVYILFFLLSTLILSLLILSALFYHRHRHGHFIVPPIDPNNNDIGGLHDVDLPPPPPPRCPPVDLQLLRFNTLLSHESKT